MRNNFVQMTLEDIYNNVTLSLENKNSNLVSLLDEHINLDELIPYTFKSAFYNRMGRSRIYFLLKNNFHFSRAVIPINLRNSKSSNSLFDSNGTPICPLDGAKFQFLGKSGGKNRSSRFKCVCPKSLAIFKSSKRFCACDTPCTSSSYGKCVYTYPDKDFRLYPGIPRDTQHWDCSFSKVIHFCVGLFFLFRFFAYFFTDFYNCLN